jgi:murein DD-endopeptidase MepM/ murein hydrolase activator NlpD
MEHTENLTSKYAHLSQFHVKEGQQVSQGQMIGLSGDTGKVTGPHLHFELRRNGVLIDPTQFLSREYRHK